MFQMNYDITLPADYDMAVIRRRVATNGHALDTFPGLGLKAYLMRERGVAGSVINQYAPFYLWTSDAAMGRFLWGGAGFDKLVGAFGRPIVGSALGVSFVRGPAYGSRPQTATRQYGVVLGDVNPQNFVAGLIRATDDWATTPGLVCVAYAVDPRAWTYVRFALWLDHPARQDDGVRFEVLHLSSPEMDKLA